MRVVIKKYDDNWQEIKDAAMFTVHKDTGKYPSSDWKMKAIHSEHSPIRLGRFLIRIYDAPSFVINHLVRHHIDFTPFVSSLRPDRANYDTVPDRNTPNNIEFDCNFQTLINISRKRLCYCASPETRDAWQQVKDEVAKVEPELAKCMVKECVYRNGLCSEFKSCGYNKTNKFEEELKDYTNFLSNQICERTNINKGS